ncbi:MAG: YcxB family protein [Oscillospiraceae bacterium]
MNKWKKLVTIVLTLALCLTFGVSVFAEAKTYEIPELGLTLDIPEGSYIFTPATPDSDPLWKEAGLDDAVKYKTEYKDMGVLVHLSANGGKTNIYVGKKETDTTKGYFSIASMTEAERAKFIEPYNTKEAGTMTSDAVYYQHSQTPFLKVDITSTPLKSDEVPVQEAVYFTIINGYTASFSTYSENEVPEESRAYLKTLVDSVHFSNILPKPELSQSDIQRAFLGLGVIVAAIVLFVLFLVFAKIRSKKRKNATKRLAERLSRYRSEKALQAEIHRESLFENITEHSDQAVRQFSIFQSYLRNPFMPMLTIVITIGGTAVSIWANAQWWMSLLLAAAAGFCIYKFVTASTTMEKALKKVYGKMKSRNAKYTFYENEFTISGMQSAADYPYFQITELREYKDTFFLYFGENNTYYVNKNSFTKGDAESFEKFLKAKIIQNKNAERA